MSIFDVFRGPSEQEANWSAGQESENKATEFNIGNHPEIQKYLAEKASNEVIGDKADSYEGMTQQRAAMVELSEI